MHGRFLTDPVNYDTEAASKKKTSQSWAEDSV